MGDVTVKIQGNPGYSNTNTPPNINTPPNTNTPPNINTPPNTNIQVPDSRLIEEVRRTIIQQGAMFVPGNNIYKPIIQSAEQIQREQINSEISQKYNIRRADTQSRMEKAYANIDETIDRDKSKAVEGISDVNQRQRIEDLWEAKRDKEFRRIGSIFDIQNEDIDREEGKEKQKANDDLTKVIKDLTDEIKRNGGNLNPNSFLSQLRRERQQAIVDRDTAEDETTAREAAQRVQDLNQKIADVVEGKAPEKHVDYGMRVIQTMMGFDQLARGITSKDLGSIIMGAGQTMTSMFGMDDKQAAKSLAWIKPIATVGTFLTQEAQKSDQMAGLAALIRGNRSVEDVRTDLYPKLFNYNPGNDVGIYNMGLSAPEFAQSASHRISQRGMVQNGITEAYYQEALERVLSLNSGALGSAGKYDRYGTNATDAISNLMDRLLRNSSSGVSYGNYVRAQEYLDIQQQLMQSQMRFSNRPNYGATNRNIEAFSQLQHYAIDDRMGGDIQSLQNQLTNPQSDREKALLYSTVQELYPETAGSIPAIEKILNDPTKMGRVTKAHMQKLENMYGGVNTNMGFLAFKHYMSGIDSPERRESIVKGILHGKAGTTLAEGSLSSESTGSKQGYASQVKNYDSLITQGLVGLSDSIYSATSKLDKMVVELSKVAKDQESLFTALKKTFNL